MNTEKCAHFTGIQNDVCKVGIRYDSFDKTKAIPCLPHLARTHPGGQQSCEKFRALTPEEIQARKVQIELSINNVGMAREAILTDLKARYFANDKSVKVQDPDTKHRWSEPQSNYFTGGGEIPCPVCKTGKLRYSRAAYNGHVHAACSTPTCVRWME